MSKLKGHQKDTIVLVDSVFVNRADRPIQFIMEQAKSSSWFKDILPILTLLLGIVIKELIDRWKERKEIVYSGEHWETELELLKEPLQKQIESLEKFLAEHKEDSQEIPQITVQAASDGSSFDGLDKAKLIKYLQRKKGYTYRDAVAFAKKVSSFVSVQKANYQDLKDKFHDYLRGREKHNDTVNTGMQALVSQFADYQLEIEKETNGDFDLHPGFVKVYKLFMTEVDPHMETGKFDLFKLEKDFIRPLSAELAEMRMDPRVMPMFDSCHKIMNGIKGVKMEKYYLNTNFMTLLGRYKSSLAALEQLGPQRT